MKDEGEAPVPEAKIGSEECLNELTAGGGSQDRCNTPVVRAT